jgi:hypothetical protein
MTKAQTIDLQAEGAQQDPPPLCQHPIQELAHLAQSADGITAGTYYCPTCGEALVHTYKAPASFNTSEKTGVEVQCCRSAPFTFKNITDIQLPPVHSPAFFILFRPIGCPSH